MDAVTYALLKGKSGGGGGGDSVFVINFDASDPSVLVERYGDIFDALSNGALVVLRQSVSGSIYNYFYPVTSPGSLYYGSDIQFVASGIIGMQDDEYYNNIERYTITQDDVTNDKFYEVVTIGN